jgi:hypothetical protein
LVGFSPSSEEAVDFGDFQVAQKSDNVMGLENRRTEDSRKWSLGGEAERVDAASRSEKFLQLRQAIPADIYALDKFRPSGAYVGLNRHKGGSRHASTQARRVRHDFG